MGDGAAERALSPRPIDIDVDPLPVAGAGRKTIDAILVDRNPTRGPELATDELRRRRHAVVRDGHRVRLRTRAQIPAQDLADIRLRQRIEEVNLLRHRVGRQLTPAVRDHVALAQGRARRLGHEQLYGLAGPLVPLADASAFGHAGASCRHRLDLVRVDVEAGDDDHVLLAVHDLEEALLVEDPDIARAEIT